LIPLSCQKLATQLGIKGFVRNLKDGRVEILTQGDNALAQTFLQNIRHLRDLLAGAEAVP